MLVSCAPHGHKLTHGKHFRMHADLAGRSTVGGLPNPTKACHAACSTGGSKCSGKCTSHLCSHTRGAASGTVGRGAAHRDHRAPGSNYVRDIQQRVWAGQGGGECLDVEHQGVFSLVMSSNRHCNLVHRVVRDNDYQENISLSSLTAITTVSSDNVSLTTHSFFAVFSHVDAIFSLLPCAHSSAARSRTDS
jgi:hypothetical protein